jgi:hypothetical protein
MEEKDSAFSSVVSINFRDDVSSQTEVNSILSLSSPGSYITWKTDDITFYLSYVSPTYKRIEHIKLNRARDGSFTIESSLNNDQSYPTLNELIESRAYLNKTPVIDFPESTISPFDGSSSALTQRKKPSASKSGLHNSFTALPDSIALPDPSLFETPVRTYFGERIVRPTCSHSIEKICFLVLAVICLIVGAASYFEYNQHAEIMYIEADTLTKLAQDNLKESNQAFMKNLFLLAKKGGEFISTSSYLQSCMNYGAQYRSDLLEIQSKVHEIFITSQGPAFLKHLLTLLLIPFVLSYSLLFITTGRKIELLPEKFTEKTNINEDVGRQRDPPCTKMQFYWSLSFATCLIVIIVLSAGIINIFWSFGSVITAFENSSKEFSTKFPRESPTGEPTFTSDGIPMPFPNDYQSALYALGPLPSNCSSKFQSYIVRLNEMPPVLKVPISNIVPDVILWTLSVVNVKFVSSIPNRDHDSLTIISDPFEGTSAAGWVDGDQFIFPSNAGVAHAIITILAFLIISYLGTLIAVDSLYQLVPDWIEKCSRLRNAGKKIRKGVKEE